MIKLRQKIFFLTFLRATLVREAVPIPSGATLVREAVPVSPSLLPSTVLIPSGATLVREAVSARLLLLSSTVPVESTLVRKALAGGGNNCATAGRFCESETNPLTTLAKCCMNCVLPLLP